MSHDHGLEDTILLICPFSSNLSTEPTINPNQNLRRLFFLADKLILNFIKKMQNARIAKANLKKKKARGLTVKLQ